MRKIYSSAEIAHRPPVVLLLFVIVREYDSTSALIVSSVSFYASTFAMKISYRVRVLANFF